jgi:heterodisulfide reductase subunit A-like polyferredoxin
MTEKTLRVVVIGGGIGGLFAANALVARGFQVSVYEQAPHLGGRLPDAEQRPPASKGEPRPGRRKVWRQGRIRLPIPA